MRVQECHQLQVEVDAEGRSPLELSRALQKLLRETRGTTGDYDLSRLPQQLTQAVRFNVEALHVELAELLDLLPWKEWKSYPADYVDQKQVEEIKFEIIDLLFFVNNLFLSLGMTDEDIQAYYFAKYQENVRRQNQEYGKPK